MLERRYTIPVLFGIFLGLILAGVQVSATALNSAVGHHRGAALVAFENSDSKEAVFWVLGKRVEVSRPDGPWAIAERTSNSLKILAEKAGVISGRAREKAGRAGDYLAAMAGRGIDRFMDIPLFKKPGD